jgi:2'-5' RNA ligase
VAYSTQLFFDPACETRIRRLCAALREANMGGQVLIEDVKARPHITLHICEDLNEMALESACQDIASRFSAIPVSLASIGIFPSDVGVVFLAPVVTEDLLEVHRATYKSSSAWAAYPWNLYTPSRWVPHCTLVNRVEREDLKEIVEMIGEVTFPISGELVEIGAAEFTKGKVVRNLFTHALQ